MENIPLSSRVDQDVESNNNHNKSFEDDMVKFQDTEDCEGLKSMKYSKIQKLSVLEIEKEKMEGEIAQLQAVNQDLETKNVLQLNEYKDTHSKQSKRINELNINIKQKEELIRNLVHDNNETSNLLAAHLNRVTELEEEVVRCRVAVESAEKVIFVIRM